MPDYSVASLLEKVRNDRNPLVYWKIQDGSGANANQVASFMPTDGESPDQARPYSDQQLLQELERLPAGRYFFDGWSKANQTGGHTRIYFHHGTAAVGQAPAAQPLPDMNTELLQRLLDTEQQRHDQTRNELKIALETIAQLRGEVKELQFNQRMDALERKLADKPSATDRMLESMLPRIAGAFLQPRPAPGVSQPPPMRTAQPGAIAGPESVPVAVPVSADSADPEFTDEQEEACGQAVNSIAAKLGTAEATVAGLQALAALDPAVLQKLNNLLTTPEGKQKLQMLNAFL